MKRLSLTFILLFSLLFAQEKIDIKKIEGTQIAKGGQDESQKLVDGDLLSYWTPFWANGNGDKSRIADIEIDQSHVIHIRVYDYEGIGTLRVFIMQDDGWWRGESYTTSRYKEWVDIPINASTNRVRLEQSGGGCRISEVEVWGIPKTLPPVQDDDVLMSLIEVSDNSAIIRLDGLSPSSIYDISVNGLKVGQFKTEYWDTDPPTSTDGQRTLDNFITTNVLGDDPLEKVRPVSSGVRIYQWLKWANDDVSNTDPNKPLNQVLFSFNPASAFSFNMDAAYKGFSELGDSYLTLFESSMYLTGNDKTWLNSAAYKKMDGRKGLDNPHRWDYVGHMYYQFAARYGRTKVDVSTLKTTSKKISGLGYFKYIEGGNEMDRWWIGKNKADLTPEELAAYMSVIYDGHQGSIKGGGLEYGAKTADPTIKVSMGGIAFVDFDELLSTGKVDWFERFFSWFENNRTGNDIYALDVVNFHDYPNTERRQRNLSGKGLNPESYGWYEKHKAFKEYIARRCPKKLEIWNTEFGYDVSQSSPQRAEPYGEFNAEQVAGMWTIRCFLEMWASGIDLAAQFYFRDENENGGGIFQSSGLTLKNSGYRERQAYFYFATTRKTMTGHSFVSRSVEGDLHKIETIGANGEKGYTLWYGTKSKKTGTYDLAVSSSRVDVIDIKDNDLDGVSHIKQSSSGKVTIDVSEMPTFIIEK